MGQCAVASTLSIEKVAPIITTLRKDLQKKWTE